MKKINLKAILILCALFVPQFASAEELNKIERLDALVVCRSKQCRPANTIMTKEFLYNKLASLLKANVNQKVLLCDADPNTRTCLDEAITFEATVGATPAEITLPSMYVLDAKTMNDLTTAEFIAEYEFKVADTYPECQASLNTLMVSATDDIGVNAAGFSCHFTSNGTTSVNASYDIDYVDLDYGILGATYSIGLSETSQGGAAGYALLRFARTPDDENLSVNCGCGCKETQNPPCQCNKQEVVTQTAKTTEEKKVVAVVNGQDGAKDTAANANEASKVSTVTEKKQEISSEKVASEQKEQQTVIVKEKVVTQYKVPPMEVVVRTKAVSFDQMPKVKVNGVPVTTKPVKTEKSSVNKMILDPNIPVVMDVEEI